MKRRVLTILLCAALLISIFPCTVASASHSGINYNQIVKDMVNYWKGREGTYETVTNDSGGVSIGILQWHNIRAVRLLKRMIAMDQAQAKKLLGSSLYNEITGASDHSWDHRSLSGSEKKLVSALIGSEIGIYCQDSQAFDDISGYVDHGYNLGIRTDPALEYFCDIENAYGSGGCVSVVNKVKNGLGVSTITSLDQFHNGVAKYVNAYMSRRNATYNYIKSLGYRTDGSMVTIPGSGVSVPEPPAPQPDPDECIGCPGEMFTDMPGKTNWAHEGIEFVVYTGLMKGTSATTFEPDTAMSRAMLVNVLYSLSGQSVGGSASGAVRRIDFADVASGKWYTKAVLWAAENGIVNGSVGEDGNLYFRPDSPVSRAELAVIFCNYTVYKTYGMKDGASLDAFPDAASVPAYAKKAVSWAVAEGLISGVSRNGVTNVEPAGTATRAQVATIVMRYVMNIVSNQNF